jgi:hypothetical protein
MLEIWLSEVFNDLARFEAFPKGRSPELDLAMQEWCANTRRDLSSVSSKIYDTQANRKPRLDEWLQVHPDSTRKIAEAVRVKKKAYGLIDGKSRPNVAWSKMERSVAERFCLVEGIGGFSIQLYQTWLLLVEVLDFSSFVDASPIERSEGASTTTPQWPLGIGTRPRATEPIRVCVE